MWRLDDVRLRSLRDIRRQDDVLLRSLGDMRRRDDVRLRSLGDMQRLDDVLLRSLGDMRRQEIGFLYLGPVFILCRKDGNHYIFSIFYVLLHSDGRQTAPAIE